MHRWLWGGVFTLPIILMGVFRLVERNWRLGKAGAMAYVTGLVYLVVIALAVPFVAPLPGNLGLLHRLPLGPLPAQNHYVAALLVFTVFWIEPEIAGFKFLRGALKVGALVVALELLAVNARIFVSPALTANSTAARTVALMLGIWSAYAAFLFVLHTREWEPRRSLALTASAIGVGGLIAIVALPLGFATLMLLALLGVSPLLMALGVCVPTDVKATKLPRLYKFGFSFLAQLPRAWHPEGTQRRD